MNDFTLRAYTSVLGGHDKVRDLHNIPSVVATWERSTAVQGGDWMGRFRLSDMPLRVLVDIFNNWLGYDIQETSGGVQWGGMVYEMELHHNLIRRRSFESMANKVYAEFDQLVSNPGFELDGSGTTFHDWNETIGGTDTITAENTLMARGSQAAKITYSNNGTTYVSQGWKVAPNTAYRISFYSRGDGTREGRYVVRDDTAGSDIIALTATGNTTTSYRRVSVDITTPAACVLMTLRLYAPSAAGSVYYDDATAQQLRDGNPIKLLTDAVEVPASQQQYGIKEKIITGYDSKAEAERAAAHYVAAHGWPTVERESGQAGSEPYLDVTVCGYVFTSMWQLAPAGTQSGATLTVQANALLDAWQYVDTRAVKAGAAAAYTWLDEKRRTIREAFNALVMVDPDDPFRLHMNAGRRATFEPISNEPVLFLQDGQFYASRGGRKARLRQVADRQLQPGVCRDLDYPVTAVQPGSFFEDGRDFLLDEIAAGPNGLRWSIAEV